VAYFASPGTERTPAEDTALTDVGDTLAGAPSIVTTEERIYPAETSTSARDLAEPIDENNRPENTEVRELQVNRSTTTDDKGQDRSSSSSTSTQQTASTSVAALTIADIESNMVRVAGGTFTMGCEEERDLDCRDYEKPAHTVTVPTFYISKYEVTQAQWRAVMGNNSAHNQECDLCPVEKVSWDDVQVFLQKLNAQTGKKYRLPTEAEWEYAARGGNDSQGYRFSVSNIITDVAWYIMNSEESNTYGRKPTTRPVGGKRANELGLHDMSGNVWEWCEDSWHKNYQGAPTEGGGWEGSSNGRVIRGGSWISGDSLCRVSGRFGVSHFNRDLSLGFRVARY
ncbi:MAG: formylglycine-generating enzyme family protein, partial [Bacteroidota bacterium]